MGKTWSMLAAAALASFLLHRFAFSANDPLSGTLAILPLTAALFWTASRLSRLPLPAHSATRLGGAFALAGLALTRGDLGLRWEDALGAPVIVAAYLVLFFWQAGAQIAAAARCRTQTTRRYLGFAAIVLAVYVGIAPWSLGQRPPDGDEPWYLLLTHSLAYDFDTDLSNNYEAGNSLRFMPRRIGPQFGDPVGARGEQYSRHNMTLPLALAPAYRLAGKTGAVAVMVLLAALLATWSVAVADRLFPERPREVLLAGAAAGLASPLLLYSHQVWVEVPAALAVVVGFDGVLGIRESRSLRFQDMSKLALSVVLLPLLKLRFVLLSVGLLTVAVRNTDRSVRTWIVRGGLALLATTSAILVFNSLLFGSALKHHSYRSLIAYWTSPASYLTAPFGLVLDGAFGLLASAPLWLLVVPGAILVWRRSKALVGDIVIVSLPYLLLLGPRTEWYGGWSPPFRYGLVFLPFLMLLMIPVLAKLDRPGVRSVTAMLAAATICLGLVALVVPGWTYNFADGRSYLLDALTLDFGTDIARLFPSWVRPRAANNIWLAVALAGALWLAYQRGGRAGQNATALGLAAFLVAMALLPVASAGLPVGTIEFEDPYTRSTGGEPYPPRWTKFRAAYRGSWKLDPGDEVGVEIKPQAPYLRLELEYQKVEPRKRAEVEILADGEVIETVSLPPSRGWNRLVLNPLPWPGGTNLGFRLSAASATAVLLDRADLHWTEAADPYSRPLG